MESMTVPASDVSWQVLRGIVRQWIGSAAELSEVKPLVGGCINTTLALQTVDGQRAVIKISPHRVNRHYEDEAYQLNVMRGLGLPVPEIYACKVGTLDDPHSYILMEFIDGVNLAEARRRCSPETFDQLQMHLAELVVTLHAHTNTHYARVTGTDTQTFTSWPTFYRSVYDPIWQEVEKAKSLPVKARKQIGKIHDRLERLIDHADRPRLVHFDLWATNILARPDDDGRWWVVSLLDPNCKFGHAEAELAYLELFNTITPAFLRTYQQTFPLAPDYHRRRKLVYQLYHLINHVNHFGQEYVKPLTATLEKLEAVV